MATVTQRPSAQDGIEREASKDPSVHRALIVVDPPMRGRDIANLQRATRTRLLARGLADDVAVPTHGAFTAATALACIEAQYWLGLRSDTYLRKDEHGHRVVTEGAQRILRTPGSRSELQLARAKARSIRLADGPRLFPGLAAEIGARGKGAASAIAFAERQVGTKESPPGSNSGPKINDWCELAGYDQPVPWCGCFVNACIIAGGVPSGASWGIGYTPSILAQARNRRDGWSLHRTGMRGDLALLDGSPGGDPVEHVEIVVARLSDTRYATIGGNTSSGNGSQSDGGMVARRERATTGGWRIIGFARPPYPA